MKRIVFEKLNICQVDKGKEKDIWIDVTAYTVDVQTGIECWLTTRSRGWTGLQENRVDSN